MDALSDASAYGRSREKVCLTCFVRAGADLFAFVMRAAAKALKLHLSVGFLRAEQRQPKHPQKTLP